ncbi:MAG: helix-turn-helix domain-containing protein [Nocardioides sp.]|uniref:helix-turn-helix domain-containing protein n=1 Tax=Nocardioides sp. TaxID=35761 RepID=UPI0039E58F59
MEKVKIATPAEWEHFVSAHYYPVSLDRIAPDFVALGRFADLGHGVRLVQLQTGESGFKRTRRQIDDSPSGDLLFLMQLGGHACLEQDGTQVVVGPGEATFFDPTVPYEGFARGPQTQVVTIVPRREILRSSRVAVPLQVHSMQSTLVRIFHHLTREVAPDFEPHAAQNQGLARAAIELIAGVHQGGEALDSPGYHASERSRVEEYIRQHLGDSTLTTASIAAANAMSVRHLYDLFAPHDSPGTFVRRERMRHAERELCDSATATSIAEIAVRWGYRDASSFSRAFVRVTGRSPTAVRTTKRS